MCVVSIVDNPDRGAKHGEWYESSMDGQGIAKILYRKRSGFDQTYDMLVSLSGQCCQRAGVWRIRSLIDHAIKLRAKFSRIDVNVDDYLGDLDLRELAVARMQRRYTDFLKSREINSHDDQSPRGGHTVEFGNRQSGKFLRFYDAYPVHGIDAIRMEVELKGHYANEIANAIAKCETKKSLSEMLGGMLNGLFRITTEPKNHNTARNTTASFWQRFSDRLGNAKKLAPPRVERCIKKKIAWMVNFVSKSVAMCKLYFGKDYAEWERLLLKRGASRLTASDFALLGITEQEELRRALLINEDIRGGDHDEYWDDQYNDYFSRRELDLAF
jgi:DNA relaxase NicK